MAYNIKQLTLKDVGASTTTEYIHKGGASTTIPYEYIIINSDKLGSPNVTKMGYCTNDNRGMNYPIFLTLNGTKTEFQIGKTGMFEFQPEDWEDVNTGEKDTAEINLSEVEVPAGFEFCLDYCYKV